MTTARVSNKGARPAGSVDVGGDRIPAYVSVEGALGAALRLSRNLGYEPVSVWRVGSSSAAYVVGIAAPGVSVGELHATVTAAAPGSSRKDKE